MTNVINQQIAQCQQTLVEARCAGNKQSEACALSSLGEAYIRLEEIEQAREILHEALEIANQSGASQTIGRILANLGRIHASRGETRKAILRYMEALEAAEQGADRHTQIAMLDNLIKIYQEADEPDKVAICAEHKHVVEAQPNIDTSENGKLEWGLLGVDTGYQTDKDSAQATENTGENNQRNSTMTESVKESSIFSRLVGGTAFTGLGRLSSLFFSFAIVFIVTRAMPAEDYGSFVFLRLIVLFLGQISGFGLDSALPVFIGDAHDADTKRRTFSTVIYFRLLIIAIVSLIAIPLRTQIAALFGSSIEQELVVFIPILFLLETLLCLMQSALQSFLQFGRLGISDFIAGLVNIILVVFFVLWFRLGFLGLIYARCLALIVALIFTLISLPVEKRLEFDIDILRRLIKFGAPLQVNNILSFIFNRIDTVLIGILLGTEGVAYYEIARKIPDSLTPIFEAYRMVYFPYISRFYAEKQLERLAKLLNNSNRLIAFITLLGALVTLLFGRELVVLFFTVEYEPSTWPLIVLMIASCFYMVGYILGTSLVAIGDTTKPPMINTAHMLVTVIGNLLLIPYMGITGAALATLAGNIITNPLNVHFLRRRDIAVDTLPYVKSMVIFGVHAVVFLALPPLSIWMRGLFFIPFLLSSFLLSVVTVADAKLLLAEVHPLLSRVLGSMSMKLNKP
ncbi:MAG: oligosaccharide flippase family protein [Anaerolineae bacterium]|nr:oligosaccharide flippase family protein [Anaerolineae bacterium]